MDPLEFVVKAGPHHRRACPVWLQLPVPPEPRPTFSIIDENGSDIACQTEILGMGSEERLALAFIVRDLPAGTSRAFRIVPGPSSVPQTVPEVAVDNAAEAPSQASRVNAD